jgi:MFS family permease
MNLSPLHILRRLGRDGRLLFATRCARLFGYGLFSVVLVLYLHEVGLSESEIDLLLLLTLLGDVVISLWLTTAADRIGRRKTLFAGALLMILAGVVFAVSGNFWLLLLAATVGVISPTGNEVGPFLPVEQAALSQTLPHEERTQIFAWYSVVGSVATAIGALCSGGITQLFHDAGVSGADSYRPLAYAYAAVGAFLALIFTLVSKAVEVADTTIPTDAQAAVDPKPSARFGLHKSRRVVLKLASLFALDAFGGGFIMQSLMAYWFHVRWEMNLLTLGALFFWANLLAAGSALAAAAVARRIGLVNTMVFTHLPSNILLILVPLMPSAWLAMLVLLLRFSISQMDVPTRQSYTMAVVSPDERSAAAGVTGVARSVGASVSPMLANELIARAPLLGLPFLFAGGIKIIYDVLLYRSFVDCGSAER